MLDRKIAAALDKAGHPNTGDAEALNAARMAYKMLKGGTFTGLSGSASVRGGWQDGWNAGFDSQQQLRRKAIEELLDYQTKLMDAERRIKHLEATIKKMVRAAKGMMV